MIATHSRSRISTKLSSSRRIYRKKDTLSKVNPHFNIISYKSGNKADIYPLSSDPFEEWGLSNRKKISESGVYFYIAPPEYVIIKKLEYYKEGKSQKHLDDIKNMTLVSGEVLDYNFIRKNALERGLNEFLEALLPDH